jgi:hypothetical protein
MSHSTATIKKENTVLRDKLKFLLGRLEKRKFCYSVLEEYRAEYSREENEE